MTKSEIVAERLRNNIITGVFAIGNKIPSESELCQRHNVSRMTIRTAIGSLAAQGLVETTKGSGTYVLRSSVNTSSIFPKDQPSRTEIFEFRRILETESIALVALRATSEDIAQLQNDCMLMANATNQNDIAWHDLNFHTRISKITQNQVIIRIFEMMKDSFLIMFQQNTKLLGSKGYSDHLKIVAAIESRNSKLARQYMLEHLNWAMESTSILSFNDERSSTSEPADAEPSAT